MNSGQQELIYIFNNFEDLSEKANIMNANLEKLESTAMILHEILKNELQANKGNIINSAVKTLDKQMGDQNIFYDDSKITMRKMADYYTEIVSSMNRQRMTLYYDIIEMNRE